MRRHPPELQGEKLYGGCSIKIVGLKNAQHLNGQLGIALAFNADSERWQVRLCNGEGKLFKPANLEVVDHWAADGQGGAAVAEEKNGWSSSRKNSKEVGGAVATASAVETGGGATAVETGGGAAASSAKSPAKVLEQPKVEGSL